MYSAAATREAALAAFAARCNGGTITIYSGTQPVTPDTALAGNTALATLTFSATAFPAGADASSRVVCRRLRVRRLRATRSSARQRLDLQRRFARPR